MDKLLLRSLERYRSLVEDQIELISRFKPDGTFLFANAGYRKFFGLPEDSPGGKWQIVAHRDDLPLIEEQLSRLTPDRPIVVIENRVYNSHGEERWVQFSNRAFFDENGAISEIQSMGRDITVQKQAEEGLRASERRFRALFENSIDGMMITVIDGSILSVNKRMCEMLNMTEEEIIMAGRDGIMVQDDALSAALGERAVTGKFCGELTMRGKGGSHLPVELSSITFRDLDGPIKVGHVVRDISSRKESEMLLKRSWEELEGLVAQRTEEIKKQADLLNLAYDAIIVRCEEGRISLWNSGARETYGWTKDEALGRKIQELLKTECYSLSLEEIINRTKRDGRWEGELVHTCKDGHKITVLSRWALRNDGSGEIMEVNRNISGRKASELAVQRAFLYNRSLIEANLDPLVTIGPNGKITDVNSATVEATGFSREELIGTDFSNYFTDIRKAKAGYKKVFKEGWVRDYELTIRHRDGHTIPVVYNASIYKDESGEVIGVFAAARDITERKQAERQIIEKSNALVELNTALKVLIDHYKNDQQELEERISTNIRGRILPYLSKLKRSKMDMGQSALVEIIERSLNEISSPFLKLMSSEQFRLTPKEIDITELIKEGKTTKEIAAILGVSKRTVDTYRDNIREKLGISRKKINLTTYLLALPSTK